MQKNLNFFKAFKISLYECYINFFEKKTKFTVLGLKDETKPFTNVKKSLQCKMGNFFLNSIKIKFKI